MFMAEKKEYFKVSLKMRDLVLHDLQEAGKKEPQDYTTIENEFTNSLTIFTADPAVKGILDSNNSENKGEVEVHVMVDGEEVIPEEKYLVASNHSKDDVISGLQESEGGYKYRQGVNFEVQEAEDGKIYIEPLGSSEDKIDLHNLLTSDHTPVQATYLAASSPKDTKKKATV